MHRTEEDWYEPDWSWDSSTWYGEEWHEDYYGGKGKGNGKGKKGKSKYKGKGKNSTLFVTASPFDTEAPRAPTTTTTPGSSSGIWLEYPAKTGGLSFDRPKGDPLAGLRNLPTSKFEQEGFLYLSLIHI